MVPMRAALFRVLAPGAPGTEAGWQEALTPVRNADRQRTLYLDREERRKLLKSIDEEAAPFVTALCLLPLRPGAMAGLSAGDFEKRTRELTIGEDKTGKPRRILIPSSIATLMTEQAKNKLPAAPLFMRANGERWSKEHWNKPIAAAASAAMLPAGVTAYTLRHSVITDLVNAGLALLTVAQISDTSVEMIERHYGHLNRAAAEEALAGLAL
jgi:integrase